MFRHLLCAVAALAACSPEPERNAAEPAPLPSAAAPARAAAPVGAGGADANAPPKPGTLKTFGDWTVGCDNTLRCELRSLATAADEGGAAAVAIAREAGPDGRISFDASTDEQDGLAAEVEGSAARSPAALVAAMANGHRMIARAARGVFSVSLAGASAALRYTDAVQGRAGTVTALVAKGPKPAGSVPAAPAPPVIASVAPVGAAATASAGQLAAMRKAAACDGAMADAPEFHAMGGGTTLVLLPCSSGAYNVLETLFLLDGNGFRPPDADAPVGFAETGADGPRIPTVVNGAWKDGVLTSHAKGRGLGDCGVSQEFVWDGRRLRLSRQREMGECRGNVDFITTWRADVRRR